MNKNLIISLVALICSVFTFSACSDDDDDKKEAITIEWSTNPDFKALAIEEDMTGKAVINIKAEAGIKSLKLNISSPALTDETLALVGLSTSVDLATVELDANQAAIVAGLPYGEAVKNKKEVTFDVSKLVPMILALPGKVGEHIFSIVVTDNNDATLSKDLIFNYAEPAEE